MKGDVERKKYRMDGALGEEIVAFYSGQNRDGEKLLIIAPHGGSMELNVHKQAEHLHDKLAHKGVTTWIFKGKKGDRSAFDTWHVASTNISGENPQFDLLYEYVEHRRFNQGISFHGYSQDGVLIGGQHSENHKQTVANYLRRALPVNIPINIATTQGKYAGMEDSNILNRISNNAIQIEQSRKVRERYWKLVVDVIAKVYS